HHPISLLVYSASRDQVADVWVGGKQVLEDKRLINVNQAEILERAAAWQQRLAESDE
ncbi:MAG: TRZ/ATZ family hydrolase, partial [Gammaproteobacteria bacterium]